MLMPTKCRSDTLYELCSRLVRLVQAISIPPKRLLLRPLHDISYSRTRHLYSQKGGSKVEVKNSPPPLKTSLYKGVFVKLVEVEVNSIQFFLILFLRNLFKRSQRPHQHCWRRKYSRNFLCVSKIVSVFSLDNVEYFLKQLLSYQKLSFYGHL